MVAENFTPPYNGDILGGLSNEQDRISSSYRCKGRIIKERFREGFKGIHRVSYSRA
jgi:hypothetical protein